MATRAPLSRERVLRTAIDLADKSGVEAVTMRRLGQALGVEAMSLYHYVASKDDVLDGIVDVVVSEIEAPPEEGDWRAAIRARALSAHVVLRRHPWAPRLIATRTTMSAAMLRHMDAVMGDLRRGGLSDALAHHGMHVLGSRVLGFTQELFDSADLGPGVAAILGGEGEAAGYPSIAAVLASVRHDEDAEFEFGLDLILDGLERSRVQPPGGGASISASRSW